MSLLDIRSLELSIRQTRILRGISLSVREGEVLAVVGESGSGKSLTALSTLQLLPNDTKLSGSIRFDGEELVGAPEQRMCQLRGDDISMIFQEPMTALNPLKTIGEQIAEGIRLHTGASRREADERAAHMLERVGLPGTRAGFERFPHELSGGQRQRVGIAIACAMKPRLLIADEPTTALDVTIQAQILDLLRAIASETRMAIMLISHDLGVVADMADNIVIMKSGEIVESGPAVEVLSACRNPYTARLAEASVHVPARASAPVLTDRQEQTPLLAIRDLVCDYPGRRRSFWSPLERFVAVDRVSFDLFPRQTLALVGESGCGKSTLARAILGLHRPASGDLVFDGVDMVRGQSDDLLRAREHLQIVFQDPYGSFNPRHRVERLVAEPLHLLPHLSRQDRRDRVVAALEAVGLSGSDIERYPHEFSGGQRQRIAIARALVIEPKLIIADEPVSALDVSIRAQILDLFAELRDRLGLAYLFISHDLTVVRALCDEVMVMRAGRIVERGPVSDVFDRPAHEYTKQLLSAAPDLRSSLARRQKVS